MSIDNEKYKDLDELKTLIDKLPGAIGIYNIDNDGVKLEFLNNAYYEMLGLKRENRMQYYGGNAIDAVHPDDRINMINLVNEFVSGADFAEALHRVKNSNQEWMWLNLCGSVINRSEGHIRIYAALTNCDKIIRAQHEMDERRKREQTLLASIPGGVAIYRLKKNGKFLLDYASEGLARMCNYSLEEFKAYLASNALVNVRNEDVPLIVDAAHKSIETGEPISIRYCIHTKNGPDILQRLDATMIDDNGLGEDDEAIWYAVHTKVSEESQKTLQEQNRYHALMSALDMAVLEWVKDSGFYASEKYFEYAISEQDNKKVFANSADLDVVHPEDVDILKKFFDSKIRETKKASAILRLKMKDGSYRWTEMLGVYEYDQTGKYERIIGVFRDIDKEKIEQTEKLRNALSEARKANKAKTSFLSRVSHDMRTPLNGILGLTTLLKNRVIEPDILEDLSELEISGNYLLNLINDTLDMSRIESGKLELNPVLCDGKTVFRNSVHLAENIIKEKNINYNVHAENIPFTKLYVDVNRIEQIVMNVLSNAAKFTPKGGRINVTMSNISVKNGIITDKIVIEDNGIGMKKEFIPHIFEAFSQEDVTKTSAHQGIGLGMSITKQLLELMGGDISIESELGKGTKVTIILPLKVATKEQLDASENITEREIDEKILKNKRVLLCEDHPLNAKIATRLLNSKGMIVERAENGSKGITMFEQSKPFYYDIVLMDIRMPVMDGIEAAKRIRATKREDALIPIVAMTANAFENDIRQTKESGMNAHLSKPIQTEKMYSIIEQLLKDNYDDKGEK